VLRSMSMRGGYAVIPNSAQQECVSLRGAAKLLGVSYERVRQYVKEGRLPTEPLSAIARMRIPLWAIRAFKPKPRGAPGSRTVVGVARQVCDLQLTRYDEEGSPRGSYMHGAGARGARFTTKARSGRPVELHAVYEVEKGQPLASPTR
jgi:hypothetical protein